MYKLNKKSKATANQKIGAEGVLKTVDEHFDDLLKGKTVVFEKRVENARNINSKSLEDLTVEIEGGLGKRKTEFRIEVKNCSNCVTSEVIKKQFIERDLYNAADISQIKWKIYGQEFTKSDFEKYLKENREAIEMLKYDKIKSFFPKNMQKNITRSNYDIEFINLLKDNYENIFIKR